MTKEEFNNGTVVMSSVGYDMEAALMKSLDGEDFAKSMGCVGWDSVISVFPADLGDRNILDKENVRTKNVMKVRCDLIFFKTQDVFDYYLNKNVLYYVRN